MKTKLRKRVTTAIHDKSLTQQNLKQECDVNSILERYRKTGQLTHVRPNHGQYGDFTHMTDYRESLERVQIAQDSFLSLPAYIRKRFNNDPNQLVEFLSQDENYNEAKKLGLLSPEAVLAREKTTIKTTTKNDAATASQGDPKKPKIDVSGENT